MREIGGDATDAERPEAAAPVTWSPEEVAPDPWSPEAALQDVLDRMPPRVQRRLTTILGRWPGRILLRGAGSCVRIEIFDRSMTIAAQFFTSVFPILILLISWFGSVDSSRIAEVLDMPEESRTALDQAMDTSGSSSFGIVGALIVLASATSLSRAMTRAFAAIWLLPRPRSTLRSAWRWLTVVVTIALSLVLVRALGQVAAGVPPGNVWERVVSFVCDTALMVLVPWLLLSGAVQLRRLLPGAALFAGLMLAVRPASAVWLPRALEVSADRYGSLGVAFTYLAWLYVVAFCVLLSAVVGQVLATDPGWLGRWFRGREPVSHAGSQAAGAG